jgi:DNA-binding NtrC family response regulator
VLVVDDSATARAWLAKVLGGDYDVTPVGTADEAYAALAAQTFDCLVTDFELAQGTGADLIERAALKHPNLHAILLTAHREYEQVRALQQAGRHLVLFKPTEPKELLGWVKNAVSMSRLAEATALLSKRAKDAEPPDDDAPPPKGATRRTSRSSTRRLATEDKAPGQGPLSSRTRRLSRTERKLKRDGEGS